MWEEGEGMGGDLGLGSKNWKRSELDTGCIIRVVQSPIVQMGKLRPLGENGTFTINLWNSLKCLIMC